MTTNKTRIAEIKKEIRAIDKKLKGYSENHPTTEQKELLSKCSKLEIELCRLGESSWLS